MVNFMVTAVRTSIVSQLSGHAREIHVPDICRQKTHNLVVIYYMAPPQFAVPVQQWLDNIYLGRIGRL
jgi:hypothetical protein